jgi:hypothetical protein
MLVNRKTRWGTCRLPLCGVILIFISGLHGAGNGRWAQEYAANWLDRRKCTGRTAFWSGCADDRRGLFHEKSDVAMPGIFSGERHAQGAAP